MDVARLNFSHGAYADHMAVLQHIRSLSEELEMPVAVLQDLQGPKIRVGALDAPYPIEPGDELFLCTSITARDGNVLPMQYETFAKDVRRRRPHPVRRRQGDPDGDRNQWQGPRQAQSRLWRRHRQQKRRQPALHQDLPAFADAQGHQGPGIRLGGQGRLDRALLCAQRRGRARPQAPHPSGWLRRQGHLQDRKA